MWKERDVYAIIDQRVQEWLRTLQIMDIRSNVSPAEFMYDLTLFLFPQAYESPATDLKRLQFVKKVFQTHGIGKGEHWTPVMALCQSEDPESEREGLDAFNNLLRSLKHYFTPEPDYRKALVKKLDERQVRCEDLLRDLERVSAENKFYSDKLARIQDLLASQSGSSEAVGARSFLEAQIGQRRAKSRAITQVPARSAV